MPHAMLKRALHLGGELTAIRRELHQHPELSFQEINTSCTIAEHLREYSNLTVRYGQKHTGLQTGVVATLGAGDGPTIAIRADIDALPLQELNEQPYKSQTEGIMHACGHDAHATIAIGTAKLLSQLFEEEKINGTVKFIFQPAEEEADHDGLTGAPYMIRSGILDDVDAVIALHMNPEQKVGEVLLNEGNSMANIDTFDAVIKGSGGHAAYPHLGTDPIWMLTTILQNIQGIVSRKTSPLEPAVISVTSIQTVPSYNVIPSEVHLRGTMRSYSKTTRSLLEQELKHAFAISQSLGGNYELTVHRGEPALNNHGVVTSWLQETIKDILPSFKIHKGPFGMGGEDFGYMTQQIPGAMFFLGAGIDDGEERGLHMPKFDIDEASLTYGAAILAETAYRFLQGEYKL